MPRRQRSALRPARWLTLHYPATCHVCGTALPAGAVGFWDPATRNTTCTNIACAEADGLTRQEWAGSPISGRWVTTLNDHRVGAGVARQPEP